MKYNTTTDLSAITFGNKYIPRQSQEDARSEYDFRDCIFIETSQTLDKNKEPLTNIKDLKYIYSKKYRPYEMFNYPRPNLYSNGGIKGGKIKGITFNSSETVITGCLTVSVITAAQSTFANNANITSVSSTSITADEISSKLGIINDISGSLISSYDDAKFNTITATGIADLVAMQVRWADIAELYFSDDQYEPGTLVQFGGLNELTLAMDCANGCISEAPAVLMNTAIRKYINSIPLLLTGKTKVKVNGPIEKFDRIELSDIPGVARKHTNKQILGIALESNENVDTKLVECIIKLTI